MEIKRDQRPAPSAVPAPASTLDRNELLSVEQAAEMLGTPKSNLYQWRYKGIGPRGTTVGRRIRYRRVDLEKWLEEQADSFPCPRCSQTFTGRAKMQDHVWRAHRGTEIRP